MEIKKTIEKRLKNLRQPKETKIEKKLIRLVQEHSGVCPKWVSPGNRSVPDRICLFPGGKIWFVETKRNGENPDILQLFTHAKLRELGFEIRVITNVEQLKQFENEISGT